MAQDGKSADETIGQRVSKYRKLEGWSAQKLADEADLTRSVVTNIENGRREDLTVTELLSISVALRVPPAALLFPIDKPLLAGQSSESERPVFRPRSIDLVEWLSGRDEDFGDDDELTDFYKRLEELDAVVMYPLGMTVSATYGDAGRVARSMIRVGRSLGAAQEEVDSLSRDLHILLSAQVGRLDDDLYELLETTELSRSVVWESVLEGITDKADRSAIRRLARARDAAKENLRNVQSQARLLGMDTSTDWLVVSARKTMEMITGGPHEPRSETVARGGLAEGVVSSPLRLYREEALEAIRARWATRARLGDDGEH